MERLRDELAAALGSAPARWRGLGGGDINEAHAVELADGREVFVKTNARAPGDMFPTEALGLAWLAEAGALRVPAVLASSPRFLALELIRPARPTADRDEQLGRGLAALHRAGADGFGLGYDNYIGRLPQQNDARADWPTFYRELRLEPQLRAATDRGLVDRGLLRDAGVVMDRLDDLCGPAEPPARLHGDLWGGNAMTDERGAPVVIDPAVYGGHREIDLAMMQLFGGFGARVFAAYDEAYPLADGWRDRVPLYQLYPLLVHVNLFGGGYVGQVGAAIRTLS